MMHPSTTHCPRGSVSASGASSSSQGASRLVSTPSRSSRLPSALQLVHRHPIAQHRRVPHWATSLARQCTTKSSELPVVELQPEELGSNGVAAHCASVAHPCDSLASASGTAESAATAAAPLPAGTADAPEQLPEQLPAALQSSDSDSEATAKPGGAAAASPGGNLWKRLVFGLLLGVTGGVVIIWGQLTFLTGVLLVCYQSTQEYYSFITSKGISRGSPPPPPLVSALTTVLCVSISALTFFTKGRSGTALSIAAFLLLCVNVLANKRPTFSQLTSTLFGLFYCGYLPSFWLKLRMLAIPCPDLPFAPAVMAVLPPVTVGLLATFTAVACIIAADTGAYFVGKNLGRTKLTDISPKKTVEGAIGGLVSSVSVALLVWWLTGWPGSALAACGLGTLTFVSSIFGDLIESIMKRDAGMKDSGDLIPGHGGLLDRFDSYIFSGATTYFYMTFVLPRYGLLV